MGTDEFRLQWDGSVIAEETGVYEFIVKSEKDAAGWISFYWGKPPEELRRSKEIGDAILRQWLELFEKRAETVLK